MTDPFDLLRSHVRSVALLEHPHTDPDDLVASIIGSDPANIGGVAVGTLRPLGSRRRRRWLVASGVAIVVVGGAGVAAFRGTAPDRATDGVRCRASLENSSAIVLEPTADPVAACADLWARGALPDIDSPTASPSMPRLVACVGRDDALQVVPVPEFWSCADAGLADADLGAAATDPAVRLQTALVDRINAGECRSTIDVVAIAVEVLEIMGLDTWSVAVTDPSSTCAAVAIDVSTAQVIVRARPSAQEKP
jgi:hypothetical protein